MVSRDDEVRLVEYSDWNLEPATCSSAKRFHVNNDCEIYSQENKQVKPGIDDAGFEIEEGEDGAGVDEYPDQSHFLVVNLFADAEEDEQRYDPADGVGEAGGEFVDAEKLHRKHLHPDEQGRLFPERLVIDLNVEVILRHDHFPGDLGEIHLIPVEKGDVAEEREEKD